MKIIGYYRVSTKEQGDSGLGLLAQQASIRNFSINTGAELIGEYTDVESGKTVAREGLYNAVEKAVATGAILVVKKLDRLSREGYQIVAMLEARGVGYIEADSPSDGTLVKAIKMAIAKDEASKISSRTKDALSQIKEKIARGEIHISKNGNVVSKLGGSGEFPAAARESRSRIAKEAALKNPNNIQAWALIKPLNEAGYSRYAIAKQLNENGFKASQGGSFNVKQVSRIVELYS